jgi:hypothetical protein
MHHKESKELFDIGASEILITPNAGVDLYTLDEKKRVSDNIHSNLNASAIVINSTDKSIIIVSLDLIWVDKNFSSKVQKWVKSQDEMFNSKVLLVATHSHSTPQISSKISSLARPNLVYLDFLYKEICQLIVNAWANQERCYVKLSVSSPGLSINRRKKILDLQSLKNGILKTIVANRPNYKGAKDDLLYSVWFYRMDGSEKTVLLNYACHASLFRNNAVSSDYPGEVKIYLQNKVSKKLIVCFLQGFTGNIKADIVKSSCLSRHKNFQTYLYNCFFDRLQFNKEISDAEIRNFSKKLAVSALDRRGEISVSPELSFINKTIKLPLQGETKIKHVNLEFFYVSIGNLLKIALFGGEMFSEYSLWMREYVSHKDYHLLTVGYCNDIVGYLPTKKSINEGGYEVERTSDFALNSPFSDKIETIIKNEFKKAVD